uniref:LBH domain-containing protein n=1 Tax=Denticeps clupeoides TaxID=299321 RepID=A0AAY4A5I9_9TELE
MLPYFTCVFSVMTTGPQTNMDELQMQKQGRRLIFPEPVSDSVKTMCGWEQEKKRLPSIIVEATEATELAEDEGGALRWPPQGQRFFFSQFLICQNYTLHDRDQLFMIGPLSVSE